jgi:hypothetical protein
VPGEAVEQALAARHSAESKALVAFHFYAMAIEAAGRADLGEMHAATLVATTALGAMEDLQGCEYGLEIRVLCADALERAGSAQAADARRRTIEYANALVSTVRDPRLRKLFPQRPLNAALLLQASEIAVSGMGQEDSVHPGGGDRIQGRPVA